LYNRTAANDEGLLANARNAKSMQAANVHYFRTDLFHYPRAH